MGPNGIGKSTLLGLISGELEPTKGHVFRNPKVGCGTAGSEVVPHAPSCYMYCGTACACLSASAARARHLNPSTSAEPGPWRPAPRCCQMSSAILRLPASLPASLPLFFKAASSRHSPLPPLCLPHSLFHSYFPPFPLPVLGRTELLLCPPASPPPFNACRCAWPPSASITWMGWTWR